VLQLVLPMFGELVVLARASVLALLLASLQVLVPTSFLVPVLMSFPALALV